MEFQLWALLLLIADRNGFRSPAPGTRGYVLDAGANDGASAEMIATAFGRRHLRVLAVEPLRSNVKVIEERAARLPNLEVLHAGLGETNGTVGRYPWVWDARRGHIGLQIAVWMPQSNRGNATYPVVTIDALFAPEHKRTLVLAHLDLEGREPEALRAANATIRRDRPILTAETYPEYTPERHRAVMDYFEAMEYSVYTVRERVGGIPDGRNRVAVPRENGHLRWIANHYFSVAA